MFVGLEIAVDDARPRARRRAPRGAASTTGAASCGVRRRVRLMRSLERLAVEELHHHVAVAVGAASPRSSTSTMCSDPMRPGRLRLALEAPHGVGLRGDVARAAP